MDLLFLTLKKIWLYLLRLYLSKLSMDLKAIRNRIKIVNRYKDLKGRGFSEDQTLTLLSFMFELTSDGFEQYIRDYFDEILHFDKVVVTGGIHDKGMDVQGKKDNCHVVIQCKKLITSHVVEKDVLMLIEQTKDVKRRLGDTLSLYFITTNRINRQAWARANENGIHMLYYKDILKMNQKLDINAFLKKYKNNQKLVEKIDAQEVLNLYYHRVEFGNILGSLLYFLFYKINPYYIDFEKVEKTRPEKEANQRLLEKIPIFCKKLSSH